jgi:hypothetical protein
MSISNPNSTDEQRFDLDIESRAEDGTLTTDDPLSYFKQVFPDHPNPEKQLSIWKMLILANCVKNVGDKTIEELLDNSPISKSELDIMLLGLIDADKEYLDSTKQLFEESRRYVTTKPEQLSDEQLFSVKAIRW